MVELDTKSLPASPQDNSFNDPIILNEVSKSVTANSLNPSTFTQKLYVMLQDENLQDVIYWNEDTKNSFFIIPNEKFIQLLSIFFKHCNTSSFVRQLNMYSFHKISGNTNSLWEFKHAQSFFKKGDIESLYKVKRRSTASKIIPASTGSTLKNSSANNLTPVINTIPSKRKSLGTADTDDDRNRKRVASLPNEFSGIYDKNLMYDGIARSDRYDSSASKIVNPVMSAGTDLYVGNVVMNPHYRNNSTEESRSLHKMMLQELSMMNTSLQNMCDVVELSVETVNSKPEALSKKETQMYRKRLDELCIELRERESALRQYFDMQFGSGIIFNQQPAQYSLVTPSTPYGSFSYQVGRPSIQGALPIGMKGPTPQAMYSIPMEDAPIYNPSQFTSIDSSKPFSNLGLGQKPSPQQHQAIQKLQTQPPKLSQQQNHHIHQQAISNIYPAAQSSIAIQPQFRDVKYEKNVEQRAFPHSSKSFSSAESNMAQFMEQSGHSLSAKNNISSTSSKHNTLPSLKEVINMNSIAKITKSSSQINGLAMKKSRSDGSPKSS
ncbi:hypothetical protein QEN19_002182 [Hanseniaspora menglaensis]